jgi:hypothetical protein
VYNQLLFHCPQVAVDVIFAAVSNQCPQRPPVRETLPTLNVAAEGLIEGTKRGDFEKAQNCKDFSFEEGWFSRQPEIRTYSPVGE